jgi:hypothetical protein
LARKQPLHEYVEVNNPASNADDVQRGHWTFETRTFNREDGLEPPAIWGKSAAELDSMTNFVNAVQVITRRDSLPIISFFGGIRVLRLHERLSPISALQVLGY